ncbi:helicase HerA-like domain-containing protein [Klebsiella pneumoniae]|uniref:helicase HerA-like domain-containing protein n=1 Tax=Klebsiella pneumoniae TaxID=573 RepID=UPI001090F175|nr:helicase HerA-like domain-containing protein [Klebsiella pneumoniae]VGF78194.1 nucleotide triphosphate hydrolase domain-containing protein [Klebsiella pneumoniae]
MSSPLLIARTLDNALYLLPAMANRHGLITGATGTGKTVTLQKLAESFSEIGVPVFMADVKGDLTGIAAAGQSSEKLQARLEKIGVSDWEPHANPVVLWDIFGEKGHPVRATVSDLGPLLLARLLNLNEVQSGVLNIIFRIADDRGLLLLDFKDLRAITQFIGDNAKSFQNQYGNINSASIGAIQRGLLTLEQQGAEHFFGEPMLDIADWMRVDASGKGVINILSAEKLYQMPKLVFFFDEAHLLFNDAPQVLLDKIEQVIRLIRSKGVGVYFVSQNPADIPDAVLGQLGNRVQHALRAFTPKDQKAVKTAAQTMRANPAFSTEQAIQELGTGEALISFLDEKGSPSVVERAMVIAPCSRMGPVSDDERNGLLNHSPLYGKYEEEVDRESAFEMLQQGVQVATGQQSAPPAKGQQSGDDDGLLGGLKDILFGSTGPRGGKRDGIVQTAAKSAVRQVTNQIVRGMLGSLLGGRKR